MTRSEYRKLLWGVGLLGGATLLLELLSFRLQAAAIGHGFALFVGLTAPAFAALGAMVVARRSAATSDARLDRSAAHLTALGGAFAVFAVISLTLVSQRIARAGGDAEMWQVALGLLSGWLPALFAGGAVGAVMRRGARWIGRFAAALAFGAAIACLAAPGLLELGGAPRLAIGNGLLFGVAALLFASSGRQAKPHTAVIWTLPLAVVALIAGDVGAPWLKMRFDLGRRSRIDHTIWSPQGLIAVHKVKRDRTKLQIDRGPEVPLAEEREPKRKPSFLPQDLVYLTSLGAKGPVLVIGSAGGREVAAAMAYEHPRVDVVELHASFVNELLLDRYATITGHVLHHQHIVTPHIGDGRADLSRLPRDYQHVVVTGHGNFDQSAPRLLTGHERLYTREAIATYLDRLRADGTLLLRAPKEGLPALIAGASTALGLTPEAARRHLLACSSDEDVVLLVHLGARDARRQHNLDKRCKRSRLTVDYPLTKPPKRRAKDVAKEAERQDKLARLEAGQPASDDRPYLTAAPTLDELKGQTWASLRALRPELANGATKKKAKKGQEAEPAEPPPPKMTVIGTATAGAIVALLLLLIGLVVPPPRSGSVRGPSLSLRLAFPLFGVALATGLFALSDQLLRVVGDAAYAWTLVIPLGLVGMGAGRLWADTITTVRLRRAAGLGLAVGLGWLILIGGSHATVQGMGIAGEAPRLTLTMFLLFITGAVLGWPLAAGLRLVAAVDRAPVTWCWGAHFGGWALGGALAALLVPYLGVTGLYIVAFGSFGLGALGMMLGSRPRAVGTSASAAASSSAA